jgi:hypothetical protein
MEHHKQAFETYYGLGLKRTYQAVADKIGVSSSTIKNWSRSFKWREQIRERDVAITRQAVDQTFRQGVVENERNLKIVQAALMRSAKDIAEGKVPIRIRDLDLLIQLEERLRSITDPKVDKRGRRRTDNVVIYLPKKNCIDCPRAEGEYDVVSLPSDEDQEQDARD